MKFPAMLILLWVVPLSLIGEEPKVVTIGIQPLGKVPESEKQEVQKALANYFKAKVVILDEIALPKETFINEKSPRYRADKLLRYLRENCLGDRDYVIGLTASDISTTKYEDFATRKIKEPEWKYKDWGIFGLGSCPGPSCIVSTFRLKKGADDELFLTRLRKIACHEIGHNLGLPHCASPACFMRDANEKIATIDREPERLCPNCWKRLK